MGLGSDALGEWQDYEWFDPHLGHDGDADAAMVTLASLEREGVWQPGNATRVLLIDLDNIRVTSDSLRRRVLLAVALARQSDVSAFAGQRGSVDRARPSLQEFAATALEVGDGRNEADIALLEAVADDGDDDTQFVVFSNDGVFARLAMRGSLTVVSPGAGALSEQLREAATNVIDLQVLEAAGDT